jgi:hypothetical protein
MDDNMPSLPRGPLQSFDQLVENIRNFNRPLPTKANRITSIVSRSPDPVAAKSQILSDAQNTRVILHWRLLLLIDDYLKIKLKSGSSIEQELYRGMTWEDLIKRLIVKRPLSFMCANDDTMGRDGAYIRDAERLWPLVGTANEEKPLVLSEYLSYDEIAIGALLGVSSPTYFINSGGRNNLAKISKAGTFTERGVYVGMVGARFEKSDQMESRFMICDVDHWTPRRGYGFHHTPETQEEALLKMWARFYGSKNEVGVYGFPFITSDTGEDDPTMDMEIYKVRVEISLEIFLLEANDRGVKAQQKVHAFVVGLGLGVWQFDPSQKQIYFETLLSLLPNLHLPQIEVIEVSFVLDTHQGKKHFKVPSKARDIEVVLTKGDPAARRDGDKLLVAMYAWDGNSFPGNELWRGSLSGSGDPAAVCCSTVGEIQNGYINPFWGNLQVFGGEEGISSFRSAPS